MGYQIENAVETLKARNVSTKTSIQILAFNNKDSVRQNGKRKEKYLRHRNDHEIQPIPRISQERKIIYTESTCGDFYKRLKCINSCECVPERQKCGKEQFIGPDQIWLIYRNLQKLTVKTSKDHI